jgi:hypothetical protein
MGIEELIGKTLTEVAHDFKGYPEAIVFVDSEGQRYRLYHSNDCCERVSVDDIIGDLSDLVGAPILMAEEATNSETHPEGFDTANAFVDDSFTWTFYKLATVKGYVTIRWFGTSNGYYSERVEFERVEPS